jgi:hypothetical protein
LCSTVVLVLVVVVVAVVAAAAYEMEKFITPYRLNFKVQFNLGSSWSLN